MIYICSSQLLYVQTKLTVASLLNAYYDEFNKPSGFSCSAYMKEIRLSYRLLFADDSRSRTIYANCKRHFARHNVRRDPYLDYLCQKRTSPTGSSRNSYNKKTEFPILGGRLAIVQDYVLRQNPNSVKSLWRDRRDLLRW